MNKLRLLPIGVFLLLLGNPCFAQTPKTVCDIVANPVNNEHVATSGEVTSTDGDDEFYISSNNCSIQCDGKQGNLPTVGDYVVVYGKVEVEDGDELEIDVRNWVKEGSGGPNPPIPNPTVTTVAQALLASPGTIVELTGSVTTYTDPNDGEGIFADDTGQMKIDFEGSDVPAVGVSIIVLGTIEPEDGANEIDVYHFWEVDGGTPPNPPMGVAWNISEAIAAPVGTYVVAGGGVTNWTNIPDGEGSFEDFVASILIDFEDGVALPELAASVTVFGIMDTENGLPEIEAYEWSPGILVSVNEGSTEFAGSIYPNPFENYLNISSEDEIGSIIVRNTIGQIVGVASLNRNKVLATDTWMPGLYFVQIQTQKGNDYTFKVVKQ